MKKDHKSKKNTSKTRRRFRILYGDDEEIENEKRRRLEKQKQMFSRGGRGANFDTSPSSSPDLIDEELLAITSTTTTSNRSAVDTPTTLTSQRRFVNTRSSALSAKAFVRKNPRFCTTGLRRLIPPPTPSSLSGLHRRGRKSLVSDPATTKNVTTIIHEIQDEEEREETAELKHQRREKEEEEEIELRDEESLFAQHNNADEATIKQKREKTSSDSENRVESNQQQQQRQQLQISAINTTLEPINQSQILEPATPLEVRQPSQSPSPPPSGRIRVRRRLAAQQSSTNLRSSQATQQPTSNIRCFADSSLGQPSLRSRLRDLLEDNAPFEGFQTPPAIVSTYTTSTDLDTQGSNSTTTTLPVYGTPN